MTVPPSLISALRALGPSVASVPLTEAVRAGIGAVVGLVFAGLFVLSPAIDSQLGLYLIAPFGASSVLLFAVPNSPLAQPWAAIVGNTVAALIGVAVCLHIADPALRIALAVGLAITATILCRALHPPAGAVAMTAAMSPEAIADLGYRFALTPVAAGTLLLVLVATLYARLTGRHYPMRQVDDRNANHTVDSSPSTRAGLSAAQLNTLLERYRQNFNLGAGDLARLVGAAELQAAAQQVGPVTAGSIMSRDLVTVEPDKSVQDVAALFRRHRFTSIPVTSKGQRYLGMIFQIHLITADTVPIGPARVLMETSVPVAFMDTPLGTLLALMADGEVDAVPVLTGQQLVGVVTRTDLISAFARHSMS
ncbi:HPP family protein [Paracoccus gahaiensis]|uniref:HPP family protein n=1 Tax=Paracoccus gahaiensis TaxID=1706839 RepID=UPI003CCC8EA2